MSFSLSGIYTPIVTPFESGTEAVDYVKFEKYLRHLDKFPLAGFVILGSTGEFPFMTNAEKVEVIKFARKILRKDRVIIAGAGAESTRETIELAKQMADVGADAVIVYSPCYFKGSLTASCFIKHYTKIADNCPVPVLLYNVPCFTGIDIPIEAIVELAKHKNIVGMKETGGDITRIANIVRLTSKLSFDVLCGSIGFYVPAASVGCVGSITGLANILPAECCRLHTLIKEEKHQEALKLQQRLLEPNVMTYSVPAVKAVLRIACGIDTGVVRSPLEEVAPAQVEKFMSILREAGFR